MCKQCVEEPSPPVPRAGIRSTTGYRDGQRYGGPMNRSNALWLMFALLGVVFFGATAALFAHESSRPFGWITLVSAVVIIASAWLSYRRSKL